MDPWDDGICAYGRYSDEWDGPLDKVSLGGTILFAAMLCLTSVVTVGGFLASSLWSKSREKD
jgi:hypothetical protein